MTYNVFQVAAAVLAFAMAGSAQAADPTDPQIAHIAYSAGNIEITAGKQALARSHNKAVRAFASEMIRDHSAVNDKALALVRALKVTPQDNATSAALSKEAAATHRWLSRLSGRSFDRARMRLDRRKPGRPNSDTGKEEWDGAIGRETECGNNAASGQCDRTAAPLLLYVNGRQL